MQALGILYDLIVFLEKEKNLSQRGGEVVGNQSKWYLVYGGKGNRDRLCSTVEWNEISCCRTERESGGQARHRGVITANRPTTEIAGRF